MVLDLLMVRDPVWWSGISLSWNLPPALYNENRLVSWWISAMRWSLNFQVIRSYPCIPRTPVRRTTECPSFTDTPLISSVTATNTYREQIDKQELLITQLSLWFILKDAHTPNIIILLLNKPFYISIIYCIALFINHIYPPLIHWL